MKQLSNVFDYYVINARIKVALFISFPAIITIIVWLPQALNWGATIVTLLVTFGCFSFFSNMISNLGNDLQIKLYKLWGGEPSTIILRHCDKTIDPYTKERLHNWLESHIDGLQLPCDKEENEDPEDADSRYASAIYFLREYTRDRKKYPLIYHDLVSYGFSRNLLAVKPLGVFIAISVLLANLFIFKIEFHMIETFLTSIKSHEFIALKFLLSSSVTVLFLIIYLLQINQKHVQKRAMRYAKSLVSVCDLSPTLSKA